MSSNRMRRTRKDEQGPEDTQTRRGGTTRTRPWTPKCHRSACPLLSPSPRSHASQTTFERLRIQVVHVLPFSHACACVAYSHDRHRIVSIL